MKIIAILVLLLLVLGCQEKQEVIFPTSTELEEEITSKDLGIRLIYTQKVKTKDFIEIYPKTITEFLNLVPKESTLYIDYSKFFSTLTKNYIYIDQPAKTKIVWQENYTVEAKCRLIETNRDSITQEC